MSLISRKNQYVGLNAHFQSLAQQRHGGWSEFHAAHITDLTRLLDRVLPPEYLVRGETSMQIRWTQRESTDEPGDIKPAVARPDISIFYTGTSTPAQTAELVRPTFTLPALAMPDDPEYFLRAISIRPLHGSVEGSPVTWIELLSPANKPGGSGYRQYVEKRRATMEAGIALVEMDYLHESSPVDERIPDYTQREAGALPFVIFITPMHPERPKTETKGFGFRVEQRIPKLEIPLANQETVAVDFNDAYQQTYNSLKAFSIDVDYSQPPVNFERYDAIDRARILARMKVVTEAAARGESLENAPLPLPEIVG